ncbi:MAG: hypothetical protein ABL999_07485 [Pyrinomonadaceae bacterium]
MASNALIAGSACLGPNTLDWIRSLYFSLLGSSILTFFLKLSVLDIWSIVGFGIGCFLFMIGLYNAVKIANRFKDYEKGYPSEDKPTQPTRDYYLEKELNTIKFYKDEKKRRYVGLQHLAFYSVWLPAFFFVILAAANLERGGSSSNAEMKGLIANTNGKVEQIDNQIQSIIQANSDIDRLNSRLNEANKEVNELKEKLKNCESKSH